MVARVRWTIIVVGFAAAALQPGLAAAQQATGAGTTSAPARAAASPARSTPVKTPPKSETPPAATTTETGLRQRFDDPRPDRLGW